MTERSEMSDREDSPASFHSLESDPEEFSAVDDGAANSSPERTKTDEMERLRLKLEAMSDYSAEPPAQSESSVSGVRGADRLYSRAGECYSSGGYIDTYLTEAPRRKPPDRKRQREISLTRAGGSRKRESSERLDSAQPRQEVPPPLTDPQVPRISFDGAQSSTRMDSEFVNSYQYFGRTVSSISPGDDEDDDEFRLRPRSPSEDFSASHDSLEFERKPFKLSVDELQDAHIDRVSREADDMIRQISATLESTSPREQTFGSNLYDFRDDEDPIFQKRFELDPGFENLSREVSPSLRLSGRKQSFQQSGEDTRFTTAELEDERSPSPEASTLRSKFSTVRRDSTMEKLETLLTAHTPNPSYFDTEAMEEISTYGRIRKIKKQRSEDQRILEEFDRHFDLCFEDSGEEDEFVSIHDIDEPTDDRSIPASFYSSMIQGRIDRIDAAAAGYPDTLSPRAEEDDDDDDYPKRRGDDAFDLRRSREVFNLVEAAELERGDVASERRKSFYDELSDPLEPRRSIDGQTKMRALTPTEEMSLEIPRIPRLESQKSDESHADSEMLFIPQRSTMERSASPAKDEGIKTNRGYFEDIDTSELEEKAKLQRIIPFAEPGVKVTSTIDALGERPRTPVKAWRAELNLKTGEKIYESERYGGRDRDPIYGEAFGRFPVRKFQTMDPSRAAPDLGARRSRRDLSPRRNLYEPPAPTGRTSYKQKFAEAPAAKITSAFSAAVVDSDSYGDVGSAEGARTSTYPQKHEKRRRKQAVLRETSKDRFLRELEATPERQRRKNWTESAMSSTESAEPQTRGISPRNVRRVPSYELMESPSVSQSQDPPVTDRMSKLETPEIIRTISAESTEEWSQSGYFVKPPKRTRSRNSFVAYTTSERPGTSFGRGSNSALVQDTMLAPSPPRRTRSRSRLNEEPKEDILGATRPNPPKRSRSSSATRHPHREGDSFRDAPKRFGGDAARFDPRSGSSDRTVEVDSAALRREEASSTARGEALSGGVGEEAMHSDLNSDVYSDEEISTAFTVTFKPGGKIADIEETPVQSSKSSSRRSSNSGVDERQRTKMKRNQELLQRAIEGIESDPAMETDESENFAGILPDDQQLTPKVGRRSNGSRGTISASASVGLNEDLAAAPLVGDIGESFGASNSLTPTPSTRELEPTAVLTGSEESGVARTHAAAATSAHDARVGSQEFTSLGDRTQAVPGVVFDQNESKSTGAANAELENESRLRVGLAAEKAANRLESGTAHSGLTRANDEIDTIAVNKRDPPYYSDTAETMSTASHMTAIERPRLEVGRNSSADEAGYELVDTSGSYEKPRPPGRRRKSSATSGSAGNLKIMSQDRFGLVKPTYSDINDWARRALSSDDEMSSYHEDPQLDEHFDETLHAIDKMLANTPRVELDQLAESAKHAQISKYEELSNLREALRRKIEERQSHHVDRRQQDGPEPDTFDPPPREEDRGRLERDDPSLRDFVRACPADFPKPEEQITSITGVYIGGIGELDRLTGGLNITRPILEPEEGSQPPAESGNLLGGLLRGIRKSIDMGVAELRSISPRRQSSAEETQPQRGFFSDILQKIQDKIVDAVAADDGANRKVIAAGEMRLSSDKETFQERPKSALSGVYGEVGVARESSLPSAVRPPPVYTTDSEMSVIDYEIRKRPRRRRTRDRIFDSSSDIPNSSTNEDFEPLFKAGGSRDGRAFIDDILRVPKVPKRTKSATNLSEFATNLSVPVLPKRTRSGSLAVPTPPTRTRSKDYLRSSTELPPPLPPKNYQKINQFREGGSFAQFGSAPASTTQNRWQKGKFTDQSLRVQGSSLSERGTLPAESEPLPGRRKADSVSTTATNGIPEDFSRPQPCQSSQFVPGVQDDVIPAALSRADEKLSRVDNVTGSVAPDQYWTFQDALSDPMPSSQGANLSTKSSGPVVPPQTTTNPVEEDVFYNALETTPCVPTDGGGQSRPYDAVTAPGHRVQTPSEAGTERISQIDYKAQQRLVSSSPDRSAQPRTDVIPAEAPPAPPYIELSNYESYSDQKSAHEYELPEPGPHGAPLQAAVGRGAYGPSPVSRVTPLARKSYERPPTGPEHPRLFDAHKTLPESEKVHELPLNDSAFSQRFGETTQSNRSGLVDSASRGLESTGQGQSTYYESTPGRDQHRPPVPAAMPAKESVASSAIRGSAANPAGRETGTTTRGAADVAQPIYSYSMKTRGHVPPPLEKVGQGRPTPEFGQPPHVRGQDPTPSQTAVATPDSELTGDAQGFLSKLIPSRTKKKKRPTPFLKIDKAELERLPTMRPASPSPTRREFPAAEEMNSLQVPGQGAGEGESGVGFTRRLIRRGSNALLELTGSFRRHRSPNVVEGAVPSDSPYQTTVVETTDGTASEIKQFSEHSPTASPNSNSSPSILRRPERVKNEPGSAPEKNTRVQFISSPVHGRVLKSESKPSKAENDPLLFEEPTGPIVIDLELSAKDISFPVHGRKLKLATEGTAQPIRPTEESHLFSQYSDNADAFPRNKIPDIDPRTQITGIGRGDEMRGQFEDEEFEKDIFIPKQAKPPISLTRMLKGALTGKGLPWSSQLGGREWARKKQGRMELRKGQNSLLPSVQIGAAGLEAREIFGEEARLRRAQEELDEPKKVSKTVSFGDLMDIRQSFRNEELARMVAGAPPDAVLAHVKASPYVDSMTMETIKKLLVPDFAKLRERIEEKLRKKIPKERTEKNYQPFKFERGMNVPNEELTYEREGPLKLNSSRNSVHVKPSGKSASHSVDPIADLQTLDHSTNRNSVLAPAVAEVKRSAFEVIEEAARNASQEVPAPLIPPLELPFETFAPVAPAGQTSVGTIPATSRAHIDVPMNPRKQVSDIPAPDIDLCNRRSSLILVNAKDLDLAKPQQLSELTSVNVDLRKLRQKLPTYKQFKAAEV